MALLLNFSRHFHCINAISTITADAQQINKSDIFILMQQRNSYFRQSVRYSFFSDRMLSSVVNKSSINQPFVLVKGWLSDLILIPAENLIPILVNLVPILWPLKIDILSLKINPLAGSQTLPC